MLPADGGSGLRAGSPSPAETEAGRAWSIQVKKAFPADLCWLGVCPLAKAERFTALRRGRAWYQSFTLEHRVGFTWTLRR